MKATTLLEKMGRVSEEREYQTPGEYKKAALNSIFDMILAIHVNARRDAGFFTTTGRKNGFTATQEIKDGDGSPFATVVLTMGEKGANFELKVSASPASVYHTKVQRAGSKDSTIVVKPTDSFTDIAWKIIEATDEAFS